MNRSEFLIVGLVGLGTVIGLSIPLGHAQSPAAVRAPSAEKLVVLRKQRREALVEAVRTAEDGYRHGERDYASIARINVELLNADLDLAQDRAGRISVRERVVKQLTEIERLAAQRVENAAASRTDLLEAKAARLKAEIDLLLESAGEKRSE